MSSSAREVAHLLWLDRKPGCPEGRPLRAEDEDLLPAVPPEEPPEDGVEHHGRVGVLHEPSLTMSGARRAVFGRWPIRGKALSCTYERGHAPGPRRGACPAV